MAKYSVTCVDCGCTLQGIQLLGKTSSREWQIENNDWLCPDCARIFFSKECKKCGAVVLPHRNVEDGNITKKCNLYAHDICPDCYAAEFEAIKIEYKLPALTGKSEKQISYGEKCREHVIKKYKKVVDYLRVTYGDDCFSDYFYKFDNRMKTETDAGKWIDFSKCQIDQHPCGNDGSVLDAMRIYTDGSASQNFSTAQQIAGIIFYLSNKENREKYKDMNMLIRFLKFEKLEGIEKLTENEQKIAEHEREKTFSKMIMDQRHRSETASMYYIFNYVVDAFFLLHANDTIIDLKKYIEIIDDYTKEQLYELYYPTQQIDPEKMKAITDFYGD